MSTPTDPAPDELRTLRERAYGPAADIHDDPVALARLHELENAGRAADGAVTSASPAPASSATDASPLSTIATGEPVGTVGATGPVDPHAAASTAVAFPATAPVTDAAPDEELGPLADAAPDAATTSPRGILDSPDTTHAMRDAAPQRPWWRRRLAVVWAGTVVAALLLGVGLTLGVQALEAGRVAVLKEDPDAEWPEQLLGPGSEESVRFEDFYGLSVTARSFEDPGATDANISCIWVYREDNANMGISASGCGAARFAAQASFIVPPGSPIELREQFPVGTALLFVLDGSQVNVYAQAPDVVQPSR